MFGCVRFQSGMGTRPTVQDDRDSGIGLTADTTEQSRTSELDSVVAVDPRK
jgi:hypothetical protein